MGAMFGGGNGGGYQGPQYGQQQPPQQYGQGPYNQQATMQNAQQQQAAMMQGFGGQQQQPTGKGGSFNAPNYQQLAGFAGGPPPGANGAPPQGQPPGASPPGQPGQPAWLAAAQQAAQRAGMQQSDYQRNLATTRGDGMSGQNFSDVMAIRNNMDQNGDVRARLAQSLGDPDAASATGYGQKSAQAINNYGAGGAYYDPQQSIVAARQAAINVRKKALRGG